LLISLSVGIYTGKKRRESYYPCPVMAQG
jgi:hypothetical protein